MRSHFTSRLLFFFIGVLLVGCTQDPTSAPAGIWVSSGGELIEDGQNPWWVRNTKEVRYCLLVDNSTFSIHSDELEGIVRRALTFWQKEFSRHIRYVEQADEFDHAFHFLGVGTQSFVQTECDGVEDLRLQFGYGTLSPQQKAYLREPTRYIAMTTRTSYDERHLHARGFLYVSSDLGSQRYGGATGIAERAWMRRQTLYIVLLHELGHVFGVPHMGEIYSLMSARMPEIALKVTDGFPSDDKDLRDPAPFFVPQIDFDESPDLPGRKFFEIPPGVPILHFRLEPDARHIAVLLDSGRVGTALTRLGEIGELDLIGSDHTAVAFVTPPSQTVFNLTDDEKYLGGPFVLTVEGKGIYHAPSGAQKPIYLELDGSWPFARLMGVVNGKLEEIGSRFREFPSTPKER